MRFFLLTVLIVLIDQAIKQLFLTIVDLPWWWVDGEVGFNLVYNQGVAFSIPIGGIFIIILSLAIIFGVFYYYIKYAKSSLISQLVFAMIIGGAVGNLLDRLRFSAVIDYIQIYSYPVFNFADVTITVGFLILIIFFDRIKA